MKQSAESASSKCSSLLILCLLTGLAACEGGLLLERRPVDGSIAPADGSDFSLFPDQALLSDMDAGPRPITHCKGHIITIDKCTKSNGGVETCDGVDNDCNGIVDDLDKGGDGIYDCDRILLLGMPGSLGSSNFIKWLQSTTKAQNVERLHDSGKAPALTQDVLERYTIVIIDRLLRTYSAAEATLLARWVDAGCGLMVMTGHVGDSTSINYPNSLMAALGIEYAGALEQGPVTNFNAHAVTTSITKPITFIGGKRVDLAAKTGSISNTIIARLPDNKVAAVAQDRGKDKGRAVVWGDEWIQYDSEWNNPKYDVPRLWSNIFRWIGRY